MNLHGSKYITAAGAKKLREELDHLWRVLRPQVTQAVSEAAAMGDRSENAEYIYGKKQLREIDRRVRFLRKRLEGMTVVDRAPSDPRRVFFGAWVTVEDDAGLERRVRIVGPDEFDAADGYISMDSPMGRALLRKAVDDEFTLELPGGRRSFCCDFYRVSGMKHPVSARDKALQVNLDPRYYGAFAEIGAGQEVVRWFFRAGGAAGTIAKSMSAYDMKVSDAIYGPCARYVCRERLQSMLDHEQLLNLERLSSQRGADTAFFAFADTVSARSFRGNHECHGWMGIRFQPRPGAPDDQIIIHVRMLDVENALQQEALGIVGVNLVYGACFLADDPEKLVESLLDGLTTHRIEIDLIEFSGPGFARIDNRVMSLRLVQLGLTGAAMFAADGRVLQPAEVLYKKPVLIERGRFRPVTHVNLDLARSALRAFEAEWPGDVAPGETVSLMEITMSNLAMSNPAGGAVDLGDFISRAEVLAATGHTVMISNFSEYYRLAAYLLRYTQRRIGLAMGLQNLHAIFDEAHYTGLDGGILESFGRLFRNQLKLFVYPHLDAAGHLTTVDTLRVAEPLRHLYAHLVDRRSIVQLTDYNREFLSIYSPDVLGRIGAGGSEWEAMVPAEVARVIKARHLFGYR